MLDIDIESLIPHRKKIRIIDEVLDVQENSAVSSTVVNSDWPLFDGEAVNSLILIEAMAQTAALIEGVKRKKRGDSGVKGWLVGIKSAEFMEETIPVNTHLVVRLESTNAFDNYGVVEGTVQSGEKILATATLQALLLNEDNR